VTLMERSHPCPVDGCKHIVQPRHLMCPRHWWMAPEAQRTEVASTWQDFEVERDPNRRMEAWRGYLLAAMNATNAVNALLSGDRPRPGVQTA
jgi:hypothetical protein